MDPGLRGIMTSLVLLASLPAHAAPAAATDCGIGAYRLDDGRIIDVGASTRGLRWRMPDGETGALTPTQGRRWISTLGSTGRPDAHVVELGTCEAPRLRFDGIDGAPMRFDVRETRFEVDGAVLAGRLLLPEGASAVPVVVLVHGSERASALDHAAWQRLLPAAGVGAFVYDKRGTGRSTGRYTQDFARLAADAAAAAREARRLAGARMQALVYEGASQGGWVLPLAQAIEPADRLVVGYGLTVSPLEENRSEVLQQLAARGYAGEDLQHAAEVVDATATLMASGFREGFDRYREVRERYRDAAWYRHVDGEFSGAILRYPPALLRAVAPVARRRTDLGTPWRHEPLPALRAVDVPSLWVLAADDSEAPSARTLDDLRQLQRDGEPVTALVFPDTDHGIVEFEAAPDGRRTTTRVAEGYFRAVVEFARTGALAAPAYGRAEPLRPR